jgi:Glycosyl hydrolase catalytic core
MSRRLLTVLAVAAFLPACAPATSDAKYVIAMGDQQFGLFTDPLFTPLHITRVRYIVPYDAAIKNDFERQEADLFLTAARTSHSKVLVSFSHSRRKGRTHHLPSVKEFTKDFRAFRKRYPQVKEYSPWNEANHSSQPTVHNPKRVAEYFLATKKYCKGCTIVALDVLDSTNIKSTIGYVKKFAKYAKKGHPRIWGLHNYSDTNRFRNKGTKAVLKAVKGDLWLTETGGVVNFGGSFPYDEDRAARALNYLFTTLAPSNKRIKRVYLYQWSGAPRGTRFDAGLINPDGTPRPGYFVVKRKLTGSS